MTTTFRLKLLTCCVGAAFAQTAPVTALADSAVGVDTMLGNALNPTTLNTIYRLDPEGLDIALHSRTPTGQLYDWEPLPKELSTTSSGWVYSGLIEVGGLVVSGDEDNAWFRKYKDLDTGLYLNNFKFEAYQPDSGGYIEALGGGLGYDDQYYGLKFGRYNDWRGQVFYNETPHVFTSNYRSLWTDTEGDYLRLKDLPPGGDPAGAATTNANIATELETTDFSELGIVRRKGGLKVDKRLNDRWQFLASYGKERREGSRPFGAVFGGNPGGPNVEIPEPIDYDTHDIYAGLRYDDGVNNLNLGLTGSLFRNNISTFTVENPTFATVLGAPPAPLTAGTFDLYPDNDYWNVKGEYARSMPEFWQARFTALASFSWLSQDDGLIAPTSYPLTGGLINGVPSDNVWNTTNALSQKSADAEIDTMLFDVGLSLRPLEKLDVKGKIRYYETDNATEYWACNPLTGQWGRVINDGSGASIVAPSPVAGNNPPGTLPSDYNAAGCNFAAAQALGLVPAAGNVPIRNIPFDYSQTNYVLGGDYRLSLASSMNLTYEREEFRRDHRERDKTWEDSVKLGYVNSGFQIGSLRVSGEYGRRRGDDYNVDPYHQFRSASLGPEPTATGTNVASWIHVPDAHRKFDIADRDQWVFNGRLNMIATEAFDVGLGLQYEDNKYPNSVYGRSDHQRLGSASLDLNYQPTHRLNLYGFYTYQLGHMEQTGVQSNACVIGTTYYFWSTGAVTATPARPAATPDAVLVNTTTVTSTNWKTVCVEPSATNPLYPESRAYDIESDDRYHIVGLGGQYDFGRFIVKLDYSFMTGVTEMKYNYNPNALGITDPVQLALIGDGFPDLESSQHVLDLNLLFPISKNLAIRGLYRYENGRIDDWHYAGVEANPTGGTTAAGITTPGNAVYLDSGPQDYDNHVVGLFVQLSF